jgi:hypothetical protein
MSIGQSPDACGGEAGGGLPVHSSVQEGAQEPVSQELADALMLVGDALAKVDPALQTKVTPEILKSVARQEATHVDGSLLSGFLRVFSNLRNRLRSVTS